MHKSLLGKQAVKRREMETDVFAEALFLSMCRCHWEGVHREEEIVTVEKTGGRQIRGKSPEGEGLGGVGDAARAMPSASNRKRRWKVHRKGRRLGGFLAS